MCSSLVFKGFLCLFICKGAACVSDAGDWRAWLGQAVVGLKLWEWRLRNWEIDRVIAWIPTIVEDARIQILITRVQAKLENRQNEIRDTDMQRLWVIELIEKWKTFDSKLSQIKFYVRGNEIVSDVARLGRRQWPVYCVWEPRPRAAHHCWFLGSHGITDTKTRSTLDTVTLTAQHSRGTQNPSTDQHKLCHPEIIFISQVDCCCFKSVYFL